MIGLEDRQALALGIHIAHDGGARLHLACQIAGIDLRTLRRWKASDGLVAGDGRPLAVHPVPAHALSLAERAAVLSAANEPRFADVPPARIEPALADEGGSGRAWHPGQSALAFGYSSPLTRQNQHDSFRMRRDCSDAIRIEHVEAKLAAALPCLLLDNDLRGIP